MMPRLVRRVLQDECERARGYRHLGLPLYLARALGPGRRQAAELFSGARCSISRPVVAACFVGAAGHPHLRQSRALQTPSGSLQVMFGLGCGGRIANCAHAPDFWLAAVPPLRFAAAALCRAVRLSGQRCAREPLIDGCCSATGASQRCRVQRSVAIYGVLGRHGMGVQPAPATGGLMPLKLPWLCLSRRSRWPCWWVVSRWLSTAALGREPGEGALPAARRRRLSAWLCPGY